MKLKEIQEYYQNLSDDRLQEALEKNNDTGFLAEDLVQVVKEAQSEEGWSPAMTGDQLISEMKTWTQNIKSDGKA